MNKTKILLLLFLVSTNIFSLEINYNIKGSTKIQFLERRLNIDKSIEFKSDNEAVAYAEELKQKLENLRIFESVDVVYKDGVFYVDLDDAISIIPIPFPKYNSETGGRIGLRVYWYNTLGTLANSEFSGGINFSETNTWDSKLTVSNALIFNRYFNISASQNLLQSGKDQTSWTYNNSNISISTSFKPLKNFSYSTSLSLTGNYNYSETAIEEYKNPISLSFSHSLGRSNINWIENFRNGYSYSFGNSISLSSKLSAGLSATGTYFKAIPNFPIAFGTKLTGSVSLNGEMLGLGSNIRGVQSGDLYGDWGIFTINNIYIRTIKLDGLAEAIFGPHFDMGVTNYLKPKFGTGADFILYVDKLKSLVARGTISIDLNNLKNFTLDKLEIDITSSLFF